MVLEVVVCLMCIMLKSVSKRTPPLEMPLGSRHFERRHLDACSLNGVYTLCLLM